MTDFNTSDRDVNRAIWSWLHEDRHEDASRLAGAVLDQLDTTPQRRATRWPARRTPVMNKFVTVGLGTAAVIVAVYAGAALFGGQRGGLGSQATPTHLPTQPPNGWVAFAQYSDLSAGLFDRDIYLVREGQPARRIIGSDSDGLDQICPAFAPDGRRLAHGEAEGTGDGGYRGAAVVVSEIDAAGNASESLRIDVGGTFPPPCATWSADGRRLAFGVPLTSPVNPDRSAAGSAVWVATVPDGHVEVLPDLLATDLEWSPRGSQLAIASGQTDLVIGQHLRDGSIRLYDADSGDIRTLVGPSGVTALTWSPDGSRIAYQRSRTSDSEDQEIWVVQLDGDQEYLVASGFASIRGIGPVWSPSADRIVYQRCVTSPCSGESHDVVLLTLESEGVGEGEVVLPDLRLPGDPESAPWRPSGVTWSPDGRELLYTAWRIGSRDRMALISVPLDQGAEPVVLHENTNLSVADGEGSVPIQSWGRHPDD